MTGKKEKAMRDILELIDLKAEAGLCYFTLASAREYLKDIRKIIAEYNQHQRVEAQEK